jgi:ATP-dependent RNA helicase RhlB
MEFSEFNLNPDLQRGIAEMGYVTCMPVQEQVLAAAFGGQDLYVQSQTGTGKTAAYLIVIFQRLLSEPLINGKKAIIMVPTRELAVQVEEEAKQLGKYLPFVAGSFYGGVGYGQQQQLLRDNAQILVGTPGRVLDLNSSGYMNLMDIAFLVLDEADRMFDMGFYPDLRKLIKVVPPADKRQTMLFSATLNAWVKNLAWEYTRTPLEIEIKPETVTVDEVDQLLCHVHSDDKMKFLLGILEREHPESAIIFCNTKRYTEIVAKRLGINGIDCEFIMGDLPQSRRLKIIEDLKAGKVRFLVATDVAARGLDVDDLAMVINYDLPVEAENYVHRIGRTARAGKTGKAVSLASEQDVYELPAIERYIGKKIPTAVVDESLMGEDKSAGMRVRVNDYDDRPRRGDRGRDNRRADSRRTGPLPRRGEGRRREGSATVPPRHSGSRPRPERPRAEAGEEGRRGSGQQRPPDTGNQKPLELASLSQDERMAYYKQKYEKTGRSGGNSMPSGQNQKPDGRQRREGENRRSGQRRSGDRPRNDGTARPASAQAKQPGRAVQGPAAPQIGEGKAKKGLLGKILGIFKKG